MAIVSYPYALDMTPGGVTPVVHVSKYAVDFQIIFTLFARGGTLTIPSGGSAMIRGTKTDGTAYSAACTLSGNTVTVSGDVQMTAAEGDNTFEIVLKTSGGSEVGSANFTLSVELPALDYGTVSDSKLLEIADVAATQAALTQAADNITSSVETFEVLAEDIQDALSELVDDTLTEQGKAADAAKVGEELSNLKSDVRNQNNATQNIVALSSETPTYTVLTGKVISNAGNIINADGEKYTITDYIPVEAGWAVSYKSSRARWGNQNWAFYDADYNAVLTSGKTGSATTEEFARKIIVPLGAAFFVVAKDDNAFSSAGYGYDVRIIKKYCESINNKPESAVYTYKDDEMEDEALSGVNTSGKAIGAVGIVADVDSPNYNIAQFDVSNGDVLNIQNCQARYNNKMYAFYDSADLPIYAVDRVDNNPHDFHAVNTPFGATKLVVSGHTTAPTVSKVTRINVGIGKLSGKKWACMGDSLTEVNNRASKRYHDYIAERTGITVVNLGLGGTGYKKQYNDNLPFYQRIDTIPLDSDIITIFGSGNDCSQTLGDVTDTGTDTICGCINNTIDGIRARIVGANIGIIAPTPWQPYPTTTVGNKMDLYVGALQEICKRKGVPFLDLYHCSNMLPWEQGFREAFYTHDDGNGTHPDENGHKFFAPRIKAFLESLLM